MRIKIDFQKKVVHQTITAVETFLNFHLATKYYGESFDSIFIDFLVNPKPTKKFKRKITYNNNAEIELEQTFTLEDELTISSFEQFFNIFTESLNYLEEIDMKNRDFDEKSFFNDIKTIRTCLPKNDLELRHWQKKKEIYREIERVIYEHRNNDLAFDIRQQAQQLPLREVILMEAPLPHYPTKEELEKDRAERRRKKFSAISIQQEFFTRYLRTEMRKLKFKGQYHTISIDLDTEYAIKKGTAGITISVPFNKERYREIYPHEIDSPLVEIIPNSNEQEVNDFIADLLIKAFEYAKKKNIYLPNDELIEIIKNFKDSGYCFEWYHKRRAFKDVGFSARLLCKLNNHCFLLDIILLKGKKEFFRKTIHKSQPWHEAYRHYYEDIIIKNNKLIVTQQYNYPGSAAPIFEMEIKEITDILCKL